MKIYLKLCIVFLCISISPLHSQTLDFLKNADNGHSYLTKIRSSDQDRIFGIGYIYNTMNYEGVVYESSGADDVFLAEFDSEGSIEWLITVGSSLADDRPADMVIDEESESIYITGTVGEQAIFGQDTIEYLGRSIFLAKYDFDGNLIWMNTPGEEGGNGAYSIDLDADGNIYLGGSLLGTSVFESDISEYFTYRDVLVSYSPDGDLLWFKEIYGGVIDFDLHVNNQGDLLIGGSFYDSIRLDNEIVNIPKANQYDMFLGLFDLQGNLLSFDTGSGVSPHFVGDIISKTNGDFLVSGWSNTPDPIEFSTNSLASAENFLLTFDPKSKSVTDMSKLGEGYFLNTELLVTSNGSLLSTGMYTYQASIDGVDLPLNHVNEMYFIAFDENYDSEWYFTGNGPYNDYGTTMCQLTNGDVFLGGYFGVSMAIDSVEITADGNLNVNLFLAKFSNLVPTSQSDYSFNDDQIEVYPTLLRSETVLKMNDSSLKDHFFSLYNQNGSMVRNCKIESSVIDFTKEGLPNGAYYWSISKGEAVKGSGELILIE